MLKVYHRGANQRILILKGAFVPDLNLEAPILLQVDRERLLVHVESRVQSFFFCLGASVKYLQRSVFHYLHLEVGVS